MNQFVKKQLTICAISIPLSAAAALVPALTSIGRAFPEWESWLQLLITIPPLMLMLSSLLVNNLLVYLSPRKLTIIGLTLITLAGLAPYFLNRFELILLSRVVMGFGLGIVTTIASSMPVTYFDEGKERNFAIGLQAAFICAGGILFNLLSGWLAERGWRNIFLVQLLNVIPLLIISFMMPGFDDIDSDKRVENRRKNQIFVKEAVLITTLGFIIIVITCTYPLNLSLFIEKNGLGTAGFVGILASINSFVGFVIGMVFVKIIERLKQYTLPFGLLIAGVGVFIVTFSIASFLLVFGSVLFGIGTSVIAPALMARLYQMVPAHRIVAGVAMYQIGANLSQFISPMIINPLANMVGQTEAIRLVICGIGTVIIAISLMIGDHRQKKNISTVKSKK